VTLTWPDVERQFGPECMVAFDRDIGPPGWDAVLRLLFDRLWACEATCTCRSNGIHTDRCVVWQTPRWITNADLVRRILIRRQFRRIETEETGAREPRWFYHHSRAGRSETMRRAALVRVLLGERVLLVRPGGNVMLDSVEAVDRAFEWPRP
jgi:hypothetical protein